MKKPEIRFSSLSFLCASVTMLAGALALIGWIGKIPQLVQSTPLAFVQANTAICFFLSGLALFLANQSHFRIVRILSFVILVTGVLTLLQYLFNLNFGIDELLFKDFIHSGTSHPNRMAPNTALCFALFAAALFVSTYALNFKSGNLLTCTLGAMVFVLAFVALLGFMVGLEEAFGWGQMTRMSPQTALTFMFASSGIICLVWQNVLEVKRRLPVWSASFASLAVIAVFVGIWQSMVIDELHFIKSDIKSKHEAATHQILFELKERTLALERMGKRFEVNFSEDQYQVEWEADVINYVNHFGNFKSLDWVDSDYRVQWTMPPDGNEKEYGMNLMDDPRLAPVLNVARESRETRISPVLSAPQQEKVFSIFVPLFEQEKFIGFIRGKLVLGSFLQNIYAEVQSGIQASIYSDGKVLYFRESGETAVPEKWMISSAIEYKGLNWFFQSVPGKAYLSKLRTVIPEVVMAFGLILAWALGAAVRSSQKAKEHEVELIFINEKLEEEFAKSLQQSQALELSQNKYKNLFSQVSKIIAGVSKKTGEQFFASLAKSLSISLGFKYCLLGELDPMDDEKIKSLALWGDSGLMENITYTLPGTPCENVVGKTLCAYPGKVWEMFPEDQMLRDLNIETYVVVPLNDLSSNPMGLLCVMHDEPVVDLNHANLILSLFADAAESEMERQRYEKAFLKENALVRLSKNIAVASNDLPDMDSILEFSLREICEFIKWPVGHFYLADEPMRGLISYPVWYLQDSKRYAPFRSVTDNLYFKKGEGLPGRVLAETEPAWISDLWNDLNFPRGDISKNVGLHTGMAIPIMVGEEVGGVMEFFTENNLELDPELLESLAPLGVQLGRVLERARAESLLKKQALVLDQIHDAVISLDGKYNITAWNRGAERVFGFEEQEMLGKPFTYLFPDEEKNLQQTLVQPAIINGMYEAEMEAVQKSGGFIYVHISLSTLCDQDCFPQSIICYALDITDKKHARDQLEIYSQDLEKRVEQRTVELNTSIKKIRESKDQVEGILESIGEGLLVTDYHGKIELMNPAAENILGLKKEDVLGQYVSQVFENKTLLDCWDMKVNEKYSSRSFGFELSNNDTAVGRKYIRGSSTLLLGTGNNAIGIVVVVRDITYEKKVDHLKSQFLSTAAHELRTPLTSLQGFSEILLNKPNLEKETENKYLRYINEESLKLATIINGFLDISRIESGEGISLNKSLCSVSDTIEQSMHIFDEQINVLHKFEFNYPDEAVNWKVDLDKVEQVLKNIYSNAIKYSPNGGTITTTVKQLKDSVEIAIEDEGLGMSADQLSKVYDRFFRGDNFDADIPGSGLGMTIVKYILEAHSGKIDIQSEPGKGTRVLLNVPCDL